MGEAIRAGLPITRGGTAAQSSTRSRSRQRGATTRQSRHSPYATTAARQRHSASAPRASPARSRYTTWKTKYHRCVESNKIKKNLNNIYFFPKRETTPRFLQMRVTVLTSIECSRAIRLYDMPSPAIATTSCATRSSVELPRCVDATPRSRHQFATVLRLTSNSAALATPVRDRAATHVEQRRNVIVAIARPHPAHGVLLHLPEIVNVLRRHFF